MALYKVNYVFKSRTPLKHVWDEKTLEADSINDLLSKFVRVSTPFALKNLVSLELSILDKRFLRADIWVLLKKCDAEIQAFLKATTA